MRKRFYIAIGISVLALLAFGIQNSNTKKSLWHLENKNTQYVAGKPIQLHFSSNTTTDEKAQLFIIHSYGKTIVEGQMTNGKIKFDIPKIYTQKTGVISWFFIHPNTTPTHGKIEIIPNNQTKTLIENYLGPRSILAGGTDFTMMVTVPTDSYDNPKTEGTTVTVFDQFLSDIRSENLKTKDFIVWKNIYSNRKSGQLIASSSCDKTTTKEIETEVYPNIATDFTIQYTRNHDFADGNQISTISTSVIRDAYGNIVSDGTTVVFNILTKKQAFLKTVGTTINGIASGQILHPDHPDTYTITGYVTGIAKSNTIAVTYKPILESFRYAFSNHNRKIIVGPLTSFMGQLVPDGIKVSLRIFHNNQWVETLTEFSSRGMATFKLPRDFYKENNYHFEITALGITQKIKTKVYDTSK